MVPNRVSKHFNDKGSSKLSFPTIDSTLSTLALRAIDQSFRSSFAIQRLQDRDIFAQFDRAVEDALADLERKAQQEPNMREQAARLLEVRRIRSEARRDVLRDWLRMLIEAYREFRHDPAVLEETVKNLHAIYFPDAAEPAMYLGR